MTTLWLRSVPDFAVTTRPAAAMLSVGMGHTRSNESVLSE